MKILKRIIILIIVIAALFGASILFINNNFAAKGDDPNTTLSLDEIGNGKINDEIIVLSQKDSEDIISETSDMEFSDNNIVIKFNKKTPKSLKDLKKDEVILIRPSQENKKDKNEILSQGLVGIVQSVGSDSIILTSANIEDVFDELVIDTSLIKNQISESSVYLADGVSLEKEDIYLASSEGKVKFNIVNEKNDGAPKIEKLGINVENKMVGNTTLSGDIEITDLTIDYKLDYKKGRDPVVDDFKFQILGDISSTLEVEAKMDIKEEKDKPKNMLEKLNDNNSIGYIFFNLGAVPVQVGKGDVINPSLGVGLFLNLNTDGKVTIETNLMFNYSDSIEAGLELVKENNKSKIKTIEKKEKPNVTVKVNGIEINGETEIKGELETAAVFLTIDLASISVDAGIEAEGKLALATSINLSEDGVGLDNNLDGSLNVDCSSKFNAGVNIAKLMNLEAKYSKEIARFNMISFPNVLEFDGRTVDLSGLEEVSVIEEDINGDKIKDRVVMYGIYEGGSASGKYIVIFNGKDNKVLTTLDCSIVDNRLLDVVDINKDGIKEIHVGCYFGPPGYASYVLEYNDKSYKVIPQENKKNNSSIELIDGYKIKVTDTDLGINKIVNLTEKQREEYTKNKVYNSNGRLINASVLEKSSRPLWGIIKDIDNDGTLEYLDPILVNGIDKNDCLYVEVRVYKYVNGEFVLQDIFIQPGVYQYTEDYVEAEEFVMREEPFAKPSDGMLHLVVENVNIQEGYVDADEVQWVNYIGVSTGYRIDGIDGDISKYKLSNNCKFATTTMSPMDTDKGTSININEFKSEIDEKLIKFKETPRARLCIAKIENGEITKISTVYIP